MQYQALCELNDQLGLRSTVSQRRFGQRHQRLTETYLKMEAKPVLESAKPDPALRDWISARMNEATNELIKRGLAQTAVVEAKPAWVLPFTLLVGRIREFGREDGFDWFICSDGPLTHVASNCAESPREAARHFALQWQLLASRMGGAQGDELAKKAGALYALVEEEQLWLAR